MWKKRILFAASCLVLLVSTQAQHDTLTISLAENDLENYLDTIKTIDAEAIDTIGAFDEQDTIMSISAKKRAAIKNGNTVSAEKKPQKEEKKFVPNAKWALVFAIIPGGGQIYNRKYWKLPIVYGGFMGLTYAITWNGGYYNEYRNAYRDISLLLAGVEGGGDSWVNFIQSGQNEETVNKDWLRGVLRGKVDYYRRNRDLSIIGAVALYALSMIDAFVDAKLFDFDISPDLSLRVEPYLAPDYYNRTNLGISCRLNF